MTRSNALAVIAAVAAIGGLGACGGGQAGAPGGGGSAGGLGGGGGSPDAAMDAAVDARDATSDADSFGCPAVKPLVLSDPMVISGTASAGQTVTMQITLTDTDPNGYVSYPGAFLTSSTPGVTFAPSEAGPPGAYISGAMSKQITFSVNLAASVPSGTEVQISARAYGSGGPSKPCNGFVLSFSLTTTTATGGPAAQPGITQEMSMGSFEKQFPPNGLQTGCRQGLQMPPSHGLSMHFGGGAVQPPRLPSGPQL